MKKQFLFFTIAASAFLTSCSVSKKNISKAMDINGPSVIQKPTLVDLDVKETKVSGMATAKSNVPMEIVKEVAVKDAIKKANADVLIEQKFETETSGRLNTVTVKGFPATYKNFRPITTEDVELLKVGATQKADICESHKVEQKKKLGFVTGVLIGFGSCVLLLTMLVVAAGG